MKKSPVKKDKGNDLYRFLKGKLGEEGIVHLGGASVSSDITGWFSTGSLVLDKALGGGIPKGRIIELYGSEASGKTTLGLHIIANAQEAGADVLMIDTENALHRGYAEELGVDIDSLMITQEANTLEDVFRTIRTIALFKLDALDKGEEINDVVVLWDSLAATPAAAELDDDKLDSKEMALVPRVISGLARKVLGIVQKAKITLIIINQGKTKLRTGFGSGSMTTTPGGKTLKFMATQRIQLYSGSRDKVGDEVIGQETKFKITKNKVHPPFKEGKFYIEYGKGIDFDRELFEIALFTKIVSSKKQGWYSVKGRKKKFQRSTWSAVLDKVDGLEERILDRSGSS